MFKMLSCPNPMCISLSQTDFPSLRFAAITSHMLIQIYFFILPRRAQQNSWILERQKHVNMLQFCLFGSQQSKSSFACFHTWCERWKTDDIRKTALSSWASFGQSGGKLQLAGHSAVEGVCHIQLQNNSESLLNYMLMIFCFLAKLLQTLTLAKRQKLHQRPGDFFPPPFSLFLLLLVHVCLQKLRYEALIN